MRRAATRAHLAHGATLDLAIENALNVELLGRLPKIAVELAELRRLALLAAAAAATLRLSVIVLAPPPHLAHHAVAVAAGVAVVEVVRRDAVLGEEDVLELRAVRRPVGLRRCEARLTRRLERLKLIL